MPKKNYKATEGKSGAETTRDYIQEWKTWREDLKRYWPEIDKKQEMYEFFKSEASETSADVSLNMAFSMIESQIARLNDSTLNVVTKGKGNNNLKDFEEYISEITKNSLEDPDVATLKGSFRKIREVYNREFLVKGNAVAEVNYLYRTGITYKGNEEQKSTLVNNPCTSVRPLKSLVFNPSGPMDESDVYYLEKFVSFNSLKDQEFEEYQEENEKGEKTKRDRGIYKNLDVLKKAMEKDGKVVDHQEDMFISGESRIRRKVEPIHLLERWVGPKLCVIALTKLGQDKRSHSGVIIREAYDPLKIGWHPLILSMDYKVQGRPYAYGEIDAIYKVVRAQDTVLNQSIESVNRYLRPGIMVKDTQADLDAIITLMESGGVTYGDSDGTGAIQANPPPAQAFQLHDILQQGVERAARYSQYATGVPNQSSDKTGGTASGIARLQMAAEPNFKIKLDNLEDSFARPVARLYFKMLGNLMGEDEIRYALLQGRNPGWVKATKGILQGYATLEDMVAVGLIKPEDLEDPEVVQALVYDYGIEPAQMIEQSVVFDIDWIIDVKLDDQSEADKMEKAVLEANHVKFGLEMGVPINPEKAWIDLARKQGMEEAQDLLYTDEEQAAMQEQQQAAMAQEQEQAMQMKQMEIEAQNKQSESANEAKLKDRAMSNQASIAQEAMRQQGALANQQMQPARI